MRHRVLDIQQNLAGRGGFGQGNKNVTGVQQGKMVANVSTNEPLQLVYTPPVACWWKVQLHCSNWGTFSTDAWRYLYMQQKITPAPDNGRSTESTFSTTYPSGTQANSLGRQVSGDNYLDRHILKLWKLAAGITYTVSALYYSEDTVGDWRYDCYPTHLWMHGIAIEA